MRVVHVAFVVTFGVAVSLVPPLVPQLGAQSTDSTAAKAADSTAAGSYSEEQAGRGQQVFERICLECHTTKEVSNTEFRLKWHGKTSFDLFQYISTKMPDEKPGTLTRDEYTDVMTYVLKLNGIPAGSAALVADSATLSRAKLDLPPREGGQADAFGARLYSSAIALVTAGRRALRSTRTVR